MSISIEYLDSLYERYFTALRQHERLESIKDFEASDYSEEIHKVEVQHAKRLAELTKQNIYAYMEHHGMGVIE